MEIVRRDKTQEAAPQVWEPFGALRELMRWDPFRESLLFGPTERRGLGYAPSFDVKETKDSYVFVADVPGIKEKDLEISLHGNRLQVSGKREEEKETKEETLYTCERTYGSFLRQFTLPEDALIENIKAEMKDGVVTIVVPKKPEAQVKHITVKTKG